MNRLTEAWFEFAGVRSSARHVRLMAMPDRPHPAAKGEMMNVPGRSGGLWIPENAFEDIEISVQCTTADGFDIDEIGAWLNGGGELRFSDEPERVYRARVIDEFKRGSRYLHFDAQKFDVRFACEPFRYKYLTSPGADDISPYSGQSVVNPGTAASAPRITISGSGNGTVSIGGQLIELNGMTGGGIIVDSEMMDCFDYYGAELQNNRVTMDEFPMLAPGANFVSWTGGVTGVSIRPGWRYL